MCVDVHPDNSRLCIVAAISKLGVWPFEQLICKLKFAKYVYFSI